MTRPCAFPKALLFDMDGTITAPMLDFPAIKAEMGIVDGSILEAMERMPSDRRATCEAILLRHESHAAANSTLNAGCHELLGWIQERQIPRALVTRNSRVSLTTVLQKHRLHFDVLISREDGRPKPDPEPLHQACRGLGVEVDAAWMIGDGRYDIEAGNAAGILTVWISHGRERPFEAKPWRVVADLVELRRFLAGAG